MADLGKIVSLEEIELRCEENLNQGENVVLEYFQEVFERFPEARYIGNTDLIISIYEMGYMEVLFLWQESGFHDDIIEDVCGRLIRRFVTTAKRAE